MTNVFVSYRRDDSRHQTGRLYDRLVLRFGSPQIFKDVDSIPFGLDFRQVLSDQVARCDVVLVVIGDDWLTITDKNGNRRLHDPADFVRIEIEAALSRQIPVIPVLVGQAPVPRPEELPQSLRDLAFRNGLAVRHDPDFHTDMDRLIRGIEKVVTRPPETKPDRPRSRLRAAIATAIAFAAILFGIIYVTTDKGRIKIDVNDPNAVVQVDGQAVRIEGIGETITLKPGEHDLVVKRGDITVQTRKFEVRRGDNPALTVTLEPPPPPITDPMPPPVVDVPRPPVTVTPSPTPSVKDSLITNTLGMKLKLIPAGEFDMGAPDLEPESQDDEKPRHRVRITKPFYLGVYEVTQAEYQAVTGTNPSYFSATGEGKANVAGMDTARFPVECVSWLDAIVFCNKLSEREGLRPCYEADGKPIAGGTGYRLPTEAEWEYACRAGTKTAYSFGDTISPSDASYGGNYRYYDKSKGPYSERTALVGSYRPNAFGLYDMHGNVWEWCDDWYDEKYYSKGPAEDPLNSTHGSSRVIRGGGWNVPAENCRAASRLRDTPTGTGLNLGLRVARVPSRD
jgi:formylglycine-generating enzyme required for sulfatase activity